MVLGKVLLVLTKGLYRLLLWFTAGLSLGEEKSGNMPVHICRLKTSNFYAGFVTLFFGNNSSMLKPPPGVSDSVISP